MRLNGNHMRSIWVCPSDATMIQTIDQRLLPHRLEVRDLRTVDDAAFAIREMVVRGAPLIGVTAAYGMYLAALKAEPKDMHDALRRAGQILGATRPTAVNLSWAIDQQLKKVTDISDHQDIAGALLNSARSLADEDVRNCSRIGEHGVQLIEEIAAKKNDRPVHILTHCNAGWLACIDWGTATAPIYKAAEKGINVHVWVDETRPRNQGAHLTAYELEQQGVPHTLIVDNAGGHLMQHGMVDLVLVGSDRTTRTGDVANKIGTYLKALAAHDNSVPFYVALPSSSIDWSLRDGLREIPIEERNQDEVHLVQGVLEDEITKVRISPQGSPAANYGFDVTPARLVSGIITERGISPASEEGLLSLFPEYREVEV